MNNHQIDAHQHFWHYNPEKHVWMNEDMGVLKTDFLPKDLAPLLGDCSISGCVAVQASQHEDENTFLLGLANENDFIKGIVGWVDLRDENVEARLAHYQNFSKIKGFRHVLHDEPQRDYMLRPDFMRGVRLLEKYNYTYDLLIFVDQLAYTLDFVKAFPTQKMVIDHIAKPFIKAQVVGEWADYIHQIAAYPNVYCKISGLVTEADWHNWTPTDFEKYLDVIVEAFGIDRIMYGSDWPVCKLAAPYQAQYQLVKNYFSAFSETEQHKFFGQNAISFYNL
jgi:L-fuconolactonase